MDTLKNLSRNKAKITGVFLAALGLSAAVWSGLTDHNEITGGAYFENDKAYVPVQLDGKPLVAVAACENGFSSDRSRLTISAEKLNADLSKKLFGTVASIIETNHPICADGAVEPLEASWINRIIEKQLL